MTVKNFYSGESASNERSMVHANSAGEMRRSNKRMEDTVLPRRHWPCQLRKGQSPISPPGQINTLAFITVLLHTLKCPLDGLCNKSACHKMKMVLQHYKQCAFKRKIQLSSEEYLVRQDCKVCSQLIRIVEVHSKTDCKITADMGCPVLMCDTFRMVAKKNKIAKINCNHANQPKRSSKADS